MKQEHVQESQLLVLLSKSVFFEAASFAFYYGYLYLFVTHLDYFVGPDRSGLRFGSLSRFIGVPAALYPDRIGIHDN